MKALAEQVASQFGPVLGFPAEVTYVSDSEEYPYVEGGTADEVLRALAVRRRRRTVV